ncbi:MAG: 2,3-bisphosphoglycerate-independent phosphoglycerate mutase [Candidatus Thermoplasmatota archaeon]|nr:2,3-bisphosphoglycerate-independent phosphoglycerate mutase [Candidatus Thermoplasmatota archaeon]
MKKIVLIVLDGLGDRPNKILHGRTALQAAYRPNLNHLASLGINGVMHPIKPGIRSGSDTSHLSLLGYDPEEVYTGRGPFEALGLGLEVLPGDIAFRANFGTVDSGGIVMDRRADRISQGTDLLASSLNMNIDGYIFRVKEGVEHRAALVIHGPGLSSAVTDSDPHEVGKKVETVKGVDEAGKRTAELVNRFLEKARNILRNHPVNTERIKNGLKPANEVLLRGAGKAPDLIPFEKKYGMKGACIAGIPMITGLCNMLGMDIIKVKGATGRTDTNYEGKVSALINALKTHDFVILNFKGTDVAGHDGDPILKKSVIERVDRAIAPLKNQLENTAIAITGDHSTPCEMKDHSGDHLPILFVTSGNLRDRVKRFDEISCMEGGLEINSTNVMDYLLQISDRSDKYGA